MDNFIRELNELCKKHNVYVLGTGIIGDDRICLVKSNSFKNIVSENYRDEQYLKVTNEGYEKTICGL